MSSSDHSSGNHVQQEQQQQLRTLAEGSHVSELLVKKSRFIGYVKAVTNWKDAQSYLAQLKEEHPKARHWCFGYMAGTEERCSDDGEPTGTAGLPILGRMLLFAHGWGWWAVSFTFLMMIGSIVPHSDGINAFFVVHILILDDDDVLGHVLVRH